MFDSIVYPLIEHAELSIISLSLLIIELCRFNIRKNTLGFLIIFYYHNIQAYTKDYTSHMKFRCIGSLWRDLPIELKQPRSPNFKNVFKFTSNMS